MLHRMGIGADKFAPSTGGTTRGLEMGSSVVQNCPVPLAAEPWWEISRLIFNSTGFPGSRVQKRCRSHSAG